MIKRDYYLERTIHNMRNGEVKVITGIRRCGKSVLLFELFYDYLISSGVPDENIIKNLTRPAQVLQIQKSDNAL